jgi:Tol biopolymer transport system component
VRSARIAALACCGTLVLLTAPSSAGSSGASLNAGIVWAEPEGIFTANVDGSGIRRLVPHVADGHLDPAWSPSGDKLVFSARISDSVALHLLTVAEGTRRVLTLERRWRSPRRGRRLSHLLESSWTPDGRRFAVSDGWTFSSSTIRVVSLREGRLLRPLTSPSRRRADSAPAWSPDGRTIAFVRQPVGRRGGVGAPAIHLMSANGAGVRRLARGTSPSWSPNGRQIVYSRGDGIYRIGADGDGRTRIVGGLGTRGPSLQPRWSPDGRRILYVTRPGGIWVMEVDGTDAVRVIRRPGLSGAGWQPG